MVEAGGLNPAATVAPCQNLRGAPCLISPHNDRAAEIVIGHYPGPA